MSLKQLVLGGFGGMHCQNGLLTRLNWGLNILLFWKGWAMVRLLRYFLKLMNSWLVGWFVFMNSIGSFRSSTYKNHRERLSSELISEEFIVYNTLKMWHLDPKEKLEPPFLFFTLSIILIQKALMWASSKFAKKHFWLNGSQLPLLGLLRNGVGYKQSLVSIY